MRTFKKPIHGMLALTILMSFSPAQAAQTGAVRSSTVVGMGAIQQAPGQYSNFQYNETELQSKLLDLQVTKNKADAQWVKESVDAINILIKALIEDQVQGGLSKLADDSLTAGYNGVPLASYLEEKRNFESARDILKVKIASIAAIPSAIKDEATIQIQASGVISSDAKADKDKALSNLRVENIKKLYNVDLSPIVNQFMTAIDKVESQLDTKSFQLMCKDGTPVTQNGIHNLNPEIKNHLFSPEEKNAKAAESARLKMRPAKFDMGLNQFNKFTLNNLNSAISTYANVYRENKDVAGQVQALEMIENIFFARSFYRAVHGFALGVPRLNYNLQMLNWDYLASNNHLSFSEIGVLNQADMMDIHNKVATALDTQGARTIEVFSGNGSIMSKISSSITFLKGERSMAVLNKFVLINILKDLEEEMKLSQPGGFRQLNDIVHARFYLKPSDEQRFHEMALALEPDASAASDLNADIQTISADTLAGIYRAILVPTQQFENNLKNAAAIDQSLAIMNSDITAKTNARARRF